MRLGILPADEPVLPVEVDVIWLAPGYDPPGIVWRFDRGGGWSGVLTSS